MSKLTVQDDGSATRLAALEACEQRIFIAYRRGLDATCAIAKELVAITEDQLWRARDYENFDDYVADRLHIDGRTADRMIRTWNSRALLEQAGIELPFNESLIAELSVLPMERQADVWQGLVRVCEREDKPITANTVRKAVEVERDRLAATPAATPAPPAQRRGVQSELHIDDDEGTDKSQRAAPAIPQFSDEGERALARIAKHCGDATVEAILAGHVQMTESTVLKWAEQEDVMLRNLRYYLMDLRWHIGRALAYERRLVDGDSTLDQMILLARVRGGQVTIQHNDFVISLQQQIAAKSAAA
jgi:hypothetical protein